ncbi:MAG: hypothetical protein IMY73_01370 [Bacteroidetes bacterium]|nr:hypothetical protein [Bacteroidota bacterium]
MKKFLLSICVFFISATCFAEQNYITEKNNFVSEKINLTQINKENKTDSTSTKMSFFKRLFRKKSVEEKKLDSLAKDSAKNAKIIALQLKKEEKDSLKTERKIEKEDNKNRKIAQKELEKYIESRKVAEYVRSRENYEFIEVVKYKYPEFQSDDIAIRSFNSIEDDNLVNIKNNNLNFCKINLASSIIIALDDAIKETIDSKVYLAKGKKIIGTAEAIVIDNLERTTILYEQTTRTENNDKYKIITAIQLKNSIIKESIQQNLAKTDFIKKEEIDIIIDKTFQKLIPKTIF